MPRSSAPRLLATLVVVPTHGLLCALLWYASWLVLQSYPPLRIASVMLGITGAIGLVAGVAMRRWVRRMEARPTQPGRPEVEPLPRPTPRDWLVSGLYGLLITPFVEGTRKLAITEVPLAVVVIAAMAGAAWRLVLVRRVPGPSAMLAVALSAAALVIVGLGPDAGPPGLMIALLLVAPLASALGQLGWQAAVTAPTNRMISFAMLVAAVALQVAGIARGEEFGDAPWSATLALAAPALLVVAILALGLIGRRGHQAAIRRAGVGTVIGVLLLGDAWCGQAIAPATWLAAGLVLIAMLLQPPSIRDGN